ncbi:MAG: MarC family protein [Rhodospirillaceae bacterium]|nr:MarC family protein [Rhodospirillaceae bacterium]MBT5911816.1 MarC family protein [Rhodospirillaceae bacterium]MBT6307475.1 MarC family protein [Rhodospirillaceae bacterium]MDC1441625.1 MarC family protein [Rhodospirillaceae bacterium]
MIESFLTAFVIYFVVIDPVGSAPIFLSVTSHLTKIQKYKVAMEATIIASLIMIFFGMCGTWILHYLQISISAFKIAGGIILLLVALDMLSSKRHDRKRQQLSEDDGNDGVAVYPLAIPLLAGPAAITSVMMISGRSNINFEEMLPGYFALILVMFITALIFMLTGFFQEYINYKITSVFSRITAIILAALSIQYLINGLISLGVLRALS